jgi:hypothetical protein
MSCAIFWKSDRTLGHGKFILKRDYAEHFADHLNKYYKRSILHWVVDKDVVRTVSELCVLKGLPGGDPCWMSKMLMSYVYP